MKKEAYLDFKRVPFLRSQTIRLGDNRNDIDDFVQFLHDYNVNRSKGMTSWVDEVQAAMNTCVLDISVTHGGELLAQVGRVLVFDIFHDGVPAIEKVCTAVRAAKLDAYQFSLLTWSP